MKTNRDTLSKYLVVLAEALGTSLTPERIAVYCDLLLGQFSLGQLKGACEAFTREAGRTRFPTVPEFHGLLRGDPEVQAGKALEVLRRTMQHYGAYQSVRFEDPALMATVETLGGWVEVCNRYRDTPDDKLGFFERDFKTLYKGLATSGERPALTHFAGLIERANLGQLGGWERGQLPEPEIVLVGKDGQGGPIPLKDVAPSHALVGYHAKHLAATAAPKQLTGGEKSGEK